MKKKILISIICILSLLSVIVLMLIFLLPTKTDNNFNLKLECEDVIVNVDESATIVFRVNFPLAKVSFSIDDDSIAVVENGKIIGKRKGETNLEVKASMNEDTVTENVKVVVKDGNYAFVIKPNSSCQATGIDLIYTSPATFSFELYDKKGNQILTPKYTIITTNDISYSIEFSNILITSNCDGKMTFIFEDIDFSVTLNLIYIDML